MYWVGLAAGDRRSSLLAGAGGGARAARRRPGAGELPRRAARLPARGGAGDGGAGRAGAARLPRRPRRPRPARPRAAALAALPARGSPSSASSTTRSGRARRRRRRAAGAGTRGRCARAASRPGRSRRSGRWRSPPTSSPGAGLESWRYLADVALLILATNLFNLLDLRPGRAEKGLALLGAGLCLGAWTLAPLELLGIFAGPVLVGAWLHPARAGDAGRHRLQPDRGDRRGLAADRRWAATARLIALARGRWR